MLKVAQFQKVFIISSHVQNKEKKSLFANMSCKIEKLTGSLFGDSIEEKTKLKIISEIWPPVRSVF